MADSSKIQIKVDGHASSSNLKIPEINYNYTENGLTARREFSMRYDGYDQKWSISKDIENDAKIIL